MGGGWGEAVVSEKEKIFFLSFLYSGIFCVFVIITDVGVTKENEKRTAKKEFERNRELRRLENIYIIFILSLFFFSFFST